jgi:hypothetical protein
VLDGEETDQPRDSEEHKNGREKKLDDKNLLLTETVKLRNPLLD